jgi:hypothetical protein
MEDIVRSTWSERVKRADDLRRGLQVQVEALEEQQDQLLDLYVAGRGISEDQFKKKNGTITVKIWELKSALESSETPDVDIDEVIAFPRELSSDLPTCWNRLEAQQRPRFLRAMLPGGATHSEGAIRTAKTPWFFLPFSTQPIGESTLAPQSMIDSNRLEEWLRGIDELRMQVIPLGKAPGQLSDQAMDGECR